MIEVRGVGVAYDDGRTGRRVQALDGVDLEVPTGGVLAVIGPSGCGKSSLLRAIAGLEPLTSGRILLDGRDLDGVPTHRRGIGLMFQGHALFPHLNVAGNVGFGLSELAESERAQRVESLLDLVGLSGMGERRIDQLSGGEVQRVALARALAPEPAVLMLDEPLGSLDRVLRAQLVVELRRLVNELGVTTIHVTHDQSEAFAIADRIVVLDNGEVRQEGEPAEVWSNPASVFVADFLGHENLWTRDDGVILAPVTALSLVEPDRFADAGPLAGDDMIADAGAGSVPGGAGGYCRRVRVEDVTFGEGRYWVRARSVDDVPGELIVFEAASPPAAAEVVVAVDRSKLRRLERGA